MVAEHSFAPLLAAWLLWSRCTRTDALPFPRDDPKAARLTSSKMVDIREHCSSDSDCGDTTFLLCDHETRKCKCRDENSVLAPHSNKCLPAKQLGENCTLDGPCQLLDSHAICKDGVCVCDSGIYMSHNKNGTLCDPGGAVRTVHTGDATEAPKHPLDQNMIIVIAVLAIMFVGICVALHLFSRARFRNRRTIFNSPHPRLMQHIRLGKKKKLSQRQHIAVPPHPVARHHSFSGQGHQSPLPISRVPKTRSHECLRTAASRESSPKFEVRSKTAPLAEKESLPSTEDLEKKTPEPIQNGPATLITEESLPNAPGSPTVIITDADGGHTVVTSKSPSASSNTAVNV